MDKTVSFINNLFQNAYARVVLVVITTVLASYTIRPVPKVLTHLFNTSRVFKAVIVFLLAVLLFYPLDKTEFLISVITALIVDFGSEYLRKYYDPIVEEWEERLLALSSPVRPQPQFCLNPVKITAFSKNILLF
jgi:hypothetical protein